MNSSNKNKTNCFYDINEKDFLIKGLFKYNIKRKYR